MFEISCVPGKLPQLAAAVVCAISWCAFAAADGTLRWKGPAEGGAWMEAANWEVVGDASVSVEDLLTKKVVWDLGALADGAELSAGGSTVVIAGIQWTTANVGTVTLSSTADCRFSGENVEVRVANGNHLEWKLNHNNRWMGDTTDRKLIFLGDGTIRLNPPQWYECYHQDLQPCNATTVIIGPNVNMPMSFVTMWNNSTLKFEKDCTIGNLRLAQATTTLDLAGHTLVLGGGERANNANFELVGKVVGAGQIVHAGGVKRLYGANADLTGYAGGLTVCDADVDVAATARLPTAGLPLAVEGGGFFAFHADAAVKGLRGTAAGGMVSVEGGQTLTIAGSAGTADVYAGALSGAGEVRKAGADYSLTLTGPSRLEGTLDVDAGELVVARPVARQGLVRRWSFEDPEDLGRDSGEWGVSLVSYGQVQPFATNGVAGGRALYLPATATETCCLKVKENWQKGYPCYNHARSFSLWLKPDFLPNNGYIYREGHWAANGGQFTLWSQNGRNLICCIDNWNWSDSANSPVVATPDLMDGAWHHVVVTYEKNTLQMWYDGVLKATKTGTHALAIDNDNDELKLAYEAAGNRYVGALDEVSVWDHALTAEEVAAEYALKRIGAADPADALPTPVCHWAFNDADNIGKDERGRADLVRHPLVGSEPALIASVGALEGVSTTATSAFCLPRANMPDNFPRGLSPYTISIRLANNDWRENLPLLEWGDRTDATSLVQIQIAGCPRLLKMKPANNWTPVQWKYSQAFASTAGSRFAHLVATVDPISQVIRLYRDGAEEYSAFNCGSAGIGEGDFYLNGKEGSNVAAGALIDDVQIFDRALSPQEVATLTRSLATGRVGQILPATCAVRVGDGAKLTVSGEGLRANALTGAGEIVLAAGTDFAATSWKGFTGTVGGLGQVLLSADGAGPTEATVTNDVGLEDETLALDYQAPDGMRVKTAGVLRLPRTGTLKLLNAHGRANRWTGRVFTIAACGDYDGPATTAGWTFEPADEALDLHGRFTFENGVLKLRMAGGGFELFVR